VPQYVPLILPTQETHEPSVKMVIYNTFIPPCNTSCIGAAVNSHYTTNPGASPNAYIIGCIDAFIPAYNGHPPKFLLYYLQRGVHNIL